MINVIIILMYEELYQSSGTCVVMLGMNILTVGKTQFHSMGIQFL